ncbi:hypothetical protein K491DRAFT_719710 [Lophiostoma macrostomum CBS 122681]|uniref:Uncharacterized protein n=1 Tax=Lophiostoma macrostomum CBS 122681 TaxID=1314788 RepID=A0A6A6SV00_9PLEO|nr:hypothetical protein K491DRAFT_719710 [Lophiostoma macrostomum CBS 122681]
MTDVEDPRSGYRPCTRDAVQRAMLFYNSIQGPHKIVPVWNRDQMGDNTEVVFGGEYQNLPCRFIEIKRTKAVSGGVYDSEEHGTKIEEFRDKLLEAPYFRDFNKVLLKTGPTETGKIVVFGSTPLGRSNQLIQRACMQHLALRQLASYLSFHQMVHTKRDENSGEGLIPVHFHEVMDTKLNLAYEDAALTRIYRELPVTIWGLLTIRRHNDFEALTMIDNTSFVVQLPPPIGNKTSLDLDVRPLLPDIFLLEVDYMQHDRAEEVRAGFPAGILCEPIQPSGAYENLDKILFFYGQDKAVTIGWPNNEQAVLYVRPDLVSEMSEWPSPQPWWYGG